MQNLGKTRVPALSTYATRLGEKKGAPQRGGSGEKRGGGVEGK